MASTYPYTQGHLAQGLTSSAVSSSLAATPLESSPASQPFLRPQPLLDFAHQIHPHAPPRQQQMMMAQTGYQGIQNVHPFAPSASLCTVSPTPSLQQRRASSHLDSLSLSVTTMTPHTTNAATGTTTTIPTTSAAAAAVTVSSTAPGRTAVSVVSSSELPLHLPTHIHHTQPSHKRTQAHAQAPLTPRAQTPLSAQEWQGLVASGALPVRQALHSFIATSCEKPPETKEEARAVLEVMFQIRAGKIRRAIEEGKLSTTEALQHRVIQRRESVVEGTLKNSRRENVPSRAMSAPSESRTVSLTPDSSSNIGLQGHWIQPQLTDEPSMIVADPVQLPLPQSLQTEPMNLSTDTDMFEEKASTFGLSDDDIMSSFTTFTAKLGDSLLPRPDPSTGHAPAFGAISETGVQLTHGQFATSIQSGVPSLSPPTMGSPTTSNESPSPSPWMPWMSLEQNLLAHQKPVFGSQPSSQPLGPSQHGVPPMALNPMYSGVQQSFSMSTDQQIVEPHLLHQQGLFAPLGGPTNTGSKQGPLQADTWNQYMQYLLYQQEQDLQSSDLNAALQQQQYSQQVQVSQPPYQQSLLDPHWQATMMTMMMDPNSTQNPSRRVDRPQWINNNGLAFSGVAFQGQHQPSL